MSLRERAFARVYDRILAGAERAFLAERRAALLADATGTVLEIGGGTGVNLPHYSKAERVVLSEPSSAMRAQLAGPLAEAAAPVTVVAAPASGLPYPDGEFDTAVSTLVLCTVPDPQATLAEVRRVLKPGGAFLFIEHVRGDGRSAEWQDRIGPLWKWLAVGCEPNRDTEAAIRAAGFEVDEIERFTPPGPSWPASPMIQGRASLVDTG